MDNLGWDACDIILVTGDAYVDHASFGMAIVGRLLEAQGFRVGIISQPDWSSTEDFTRMGRPNLFFGITAGNMDSMINHYTADRRIRSNDAYTPDGVAGKRPDRAIIVYSQRCREAYIGLPIIIGGIEASLRRIAHYDYWSDKVRRSVLLDSKADLLLYGNAERAIVEVAHRLAKGEKVIAAQEAGADYVGGEDFAKKIQDGWLEFDRVVATPDMMAVVGRIGKILGPRGLMPNPKTGTVTFEVESVIKNIKAGQVEFRADKLGNLHASVGKISFDADKLCENISVLVDTVKRMKPSSSKGIYLRNFSLSSTMGPGIKVDPQTV